MTQKLNDILENIEHDTVKPKLREMLWNYVDQCEEAYLSIDPTIAEPTIIGVAHTVYQTVNEATINAQKY